MPRSVVLMPESREYVPLLRHLVRGMGLRTAIEAPISGMMVVVVPRGEEDSFVGFLRSIPGVRWADRDPVGTSGLSGCGSTGGVMTEPFHYPGPGTGNDADFSLQWYLENTGQTIVNGNCPTITPTQQFPNPDPLNSTGGTPGVDINIRNAWAITQGCQDVVVAVFDTGIQYEHPSFDYSRFFFPDMALTCPGSNEEDPFDCCPGYPATEQPCQYGFAVDTGRHGTPVASVIGAQGNNVNAVSGWPEIAGVDLNCGILSVRVAVAGYFGSIPEPFFGAAATLAAMEIIASDPTYADVRVINMSYQFNCEYYSSSPIWAAMQDAIDVLAAQGCIVVCIATNFGDGAADIRCPSKWDNVITVSGVNGLGQRWDDGAHGCGGVSGSGISVDVCAPARGLMSALCDPSLSWGSGSPPPYPPESPCYGNSPPQRGSGTSGAAPQVAGIVALLAARADELGVEWSYDLCYELLTTTATPMPPGVTDPAPSQEYGYGLVNAYAALRLLELNYYRPFHRADLTDHNVAGTWRFGVADGVTDCDDLAYFLEYAYPNEIVDKADFTTTGATFGQPGYGVPDGFVTEDDYDFYMLVLFPAAVPGGCQ